MESLKFLLGEIRDLLLEYLAREAFEGLAKALGIEKQTLALFAAIPGLLFLLGSGIHRLRRWLTRNRADGINPEVTPEREAP